MKTNCKRMKPSCVLELAESDPLVYVHGKYFGLGEKMGECVKCYAERETGG